jgi:hypothetical protein
MKAKLTCLAAAVSVPAIVVTLPHANPQVNPDGSEVHTQSSSTTISDPAYRELNARASANRSGFYVYKDADSGFNHGFASGWFGDTSKLSLNAACVDDPASATGCSTDPDRLDRNHGTVLEISFAPLSGTDFAGINIEEPEDWGSLRNGTGYDLRSAGSVVFDVRSPTGLALQFGVGQCQTPFVTLPASATYTTTTIPLTTPSLGCTPDLSNVHVLFTVVTNAASAPTGGTVLLDNIRFVPVPLRQQSDPEALSFPLSNQTFGVVPIQCLGGGCVPVPPDQVNRNLTTIYEASLTLQTLIRRGLPNDLRNARKLADTFDYALHHDNHGDLLPVAADGSLGLHNGYENGDVALFNDQLAPKQGKAGDVRLAGFTGGACLCGPSEYCLVLDGATGGNESFAILALLAAYQQFGSQRYLNDAITIGNWIVGNLTDDTGTGFGGYYFGYSDEGVQPKMLMTNKSTENNSDIFAAFTALAGMDRELHLDAAAAMWTARANVAGDFVMRMYDSANGRFYQGTVPPGTPTGPGICPNGPQRGNDVITTCDFLDSNSFSILALSASSRYQSQIDWRTPTQYILNHFGQTATATGETYQGFNIVRRPVCGNNGVAWEFTAQVVEVLRWVDALYGQSTFEAKAELYLSQIQTAQASAPFHDGEGVVASTMQSGNTLPPYEECLNTPFQCIPERVGLAATAWAIFAEQVINPLAAPALTLSAGELNFGSTRLAPPAKRRR